MTDSISMPSGTSGLMKFNDEYTSKVIIKPEHVIVLIVAVIIGITILKILT